MKKTVISTTSGLLEALKGECLYQIADFWRIWFDGYSEWNAIKGRTVHFGPWCIDLFEATTASEVEEGLNEAFEGIGVSRVVQVDHFDFREFAKLAAKMAKEGYFRDARREE